jgi:hypothetical protein
MKRLLVSLIPALFGGVLLCCTSGCELLGIVSDKASGGPTVAARYVPDSKEPMLVLVESYGLDLDSGIETECLETALIKDLTVNKVATVVDTTKLDRLRDKDPVAYKNFTVDQIGREVGARQVLYIDVNQENIISPAGSGQVRGTMRAAVRIVDCATGDLRWPTEGSSELVDIKTPWKDQKEVGQEGIRGIMASQMADNVGKLFRDWHPEEDPAIKVNTD